MIKSLTLITATPSSHQYTKNNILFYNKMWKVYWLISLVILGTAQDLSKIDPTLFSQPSPDVLLSFGEIPNNIYSSRSEDVSRTNHISKLVSSLKDHSILSQKDVVEYLNSQVIPYQSLWITNQIVVKNCPQNILLKLNEFSQVTKISEDIHYPLEELPFPTQEEVRLLVGDTPEWSLEIIKSPQANTLLRSTLDDDLPEIRVAVIDTGVLHSHDTLKSNYLAEYGWYDPINGRTDPYDDNGHGTHVTGSICGTNNIGVFPYSKYLSCRGCGTSGCPSSALIGCGQFAICPTFSDGSNANCSYAAHVVSNSWNGGQGQTWFSSVIAAWHAAGVIPVVSAGNTGPPCATLSSPADDNVISVGATTNIDSIAYFSATGPSFFGDVKPDFVAPGYEVLSAWNTQNSAYAKASGTSMSAPHVSGLIALLFAYNQDLTFDQVKSILASTADTDSLIPSGRNCGGINEEQFPNNVYGNGRVNALASLEFLIEHYPKPTQPPPTTTTTTEEPTTTTTEEPTTETTEEELPTTPPSPTKGCFHGQYWFPDETNVPNLICICQVTASSQYSYTCLTAADFE